jgi:hypothetical protein
MKLIITADPEQFILATRAARWLIDNPEHTDTVIRFEGGDTFFVWRTKTGIHARSDRAFVPEVTLAPPP